jgi:hypothetical protein
MNLFFRYIQNIRNFRAPNWLWYVVFSAIFLILVFFLSLFRADLFDVIITWFTFLMVLSVSEIFISILIGVFFKSYRLVIVLILLPIFLGTFALIDRYANEVKYGGAYDVERLIIKTLRMPTHFLEKPLRDMSDIRGGLEGDWLDLDPISPEEWDAVQLEYPHIIKDTYKEGYDFNGKTKRNYLLRPGIWPLHGQLKPAWDPFLPNTSVFNSPCRNLKMHEYILKYPKILSNILKILEKPNYYYVDFEDRMSRTRLKGRKWEADRTCLVLNIIDSKGYYRSQFRIIRTDIDRISKK